MDSADPRSSGEGGRGDNASSSSSTSTIVDHPLKETPTAPASTVQQETGKPQGAAPQKPQQQPSSKQSKVGPESIGGSTTTLPGRKDSSKSKTTALSVASSSNAAGPGTAASFRTIRSVASRLKIANQLSAAKRASERDDTVSISASTATLVAIPPDSAPPTGSIFGSRPDFRALPGMGGGGGGGKTSARINTAQQQQLQQKQQQPPLPSSLLTSDPIPQPRCEAPPPRRLFSELFTASNTELQQGKNCEGIISGGDLIFDNDFKSKVSSALLTFFFLTSFSPHLDHHPSLHHGDARRGRARHYRGDAHRVGPSPSSHRRFYAGLSGRAEQLAQRPSADCLQARTDEGGEHYHNVGRYQWPGHGRGQADWRGD